jgi:SAM-dependent methyltransferase
MLKTAALPGSDKWGVFYGSGRGSRYPDENLVRLIRGNYADLPRAGRALDVGFGTGNNLIMLAQSGFEGYGLEVSEASLVTARSLAEAAGVELRLGLLSDTTLPFEEGFFDLVLSWNAVYYYGSRTLVEQAIQEFRRVLRPGGVLLMSVIHPNSFMVRRLSDDLGDGRHRIERESPFDTRKGIDIFYEGTSSGWRQLLKSFGEVEEGFAEIDLFTPGRRDAWRLFLARKSANPI